MSRIETPLKITGQAVYTADLPLPELYAALVVSPYAHARIGRIGYAAAQAVPGFQAIVTGPGCRVLTGPLILDKPLLAYDKVRYYGEPVALVVARTQAAADEAAAKVTVDYTPLPVVGEVRKAAEAGAPLIHEGLMAYQRMVGDMNPQKDTNVAAVFHVRKGEMEKGWAACDKVVQRRFDLARSTHLAMELRASQARIAPDGTVEIWSATQSPFALKKLLAQIFQLDEGKLVLKAPLVGGAFGGKSTLFTEALAYLASRACGGRSVRVRLSREQDMASAPSRAGLSADLRLGADKEGMLRAAEMKYWLDCGAYSDISPNMAKAIAADCSGPYNIPNLACDAACVYTNHGYATAYRGFAHESYTFCLERALDALAAEVGVSPLELRQKNAIRPGDLSPTQVEITRSNAGDMGACLNALKTAPGFTEEVRRENGRVRAWGVSGMWKAPNPSTNASAGAVITFNSDGSCNLNVGVVEMGNGGKSTLRQMLAEKLCMAPERVYVTMEVDTRLNPDYWKTVASLSSYLAGRAVMNAAEDAIVQLKSLAAMALRCPVEDLEIGEECVFMRQAPQFRLGYQDLVGGVVFSDGNTLGPQLGTASGGQVIGRGSFILNHLSLLSQDAGKGKTGHAWTVAAQAVEVELDEADLSYRLLNAVTVMDVGAVLDEKAAKGLIRGGMGMGLSMAGREELAYDADCVNETTSIRAYHPLRIGEEPRYYVGFVQTPQADAPYGVRSFSEHGIIGMGAALGNALSRAAGVELNQLPLTPESIYWALAAEKGGQA